MTDPRVANEKAPFDHPQLCIPNGHNTDGRDNMVEIPVVGSGGGGKLETFQEQLTGVSGAHNLNNPCKITGINPLP